MKKSTSIAKVGGGLLGLSVFLILWQGVCSLSGLPDFILPSPLKVGQAFASDWFLLGYHLAATLGVTVVGFALSLAGAFGLGLILQKLPRLERFFRPYLVMSQTIPTVFLYPLLLIWMGFGPAPRVLVVFLACLFPILVAFLQGLKSAEQGYLDLYRTLGATPSQEFWQVRFPASLPTLFSGIRIASAYPVMSAVVSEWLGAREGVGVYMVRVFKGFETAKVFAGILVVSVVSILVYQLVITVEKTLLIRFQKEKT